MEHLEKVYRQHQLRYKQAGGGEKNMYWVTGILGLALVGAPFLVGYTEHTAAMWTSLVLGATVMGVSLLEGLADQHGRWEYWVAMIAGLAAIAAPFAFGFGAIAAAMWTTVGVGLLLAGAAATKLFYGRTELR